MPSRFPVSCRSCAAVVHSSDEHTVIVARDAVPIMPSGADKARYFAVAGCDQSDSAQNPAALHTSTLYT